MQTFYIVDLCTYSAYCIGMSGSKVFFGTFVTPKQGGVVRTLSLPPTVHGQNFRRQISVHKFPSTDNFRLRTTSGYICKLTILIHCLRCARMNELKTWIHHSKRLYKILPVGHLSQEIYLIPLSLNSVNTLLQITNLRRTFFDYSLTLFCCFLERKSPLFHYFCLDLFWRSKGTLRMFWLPGGFQHLSIFLYCFQF